MCSATEAVARTKPEPPQWAHGIEEDSSTPVRMRWRLISSRPKGEMRPTWIRARSFFRHSLSFFSTARLLRFSSMSMKSITMRPARSRSRNWRATSSAASRFVLSAVSSMSCSRVARPEFTSIETSASVGLITR
ncbi:hypothetical protein AEGHOMDF_5925 [Methylobacterium soli]|nr:hypothetical protein AEGHOMDF_5925 [Methylobacterium soli]